MKKPRVWRPPQVRVVWLDACRRSSVSGTLAAVLDLSKLRLTETSGYLLRYDDKLTVLCNDYDPPESAEEEPTFGDTVTIPSGWVLAVMKGRRKVEKTAQAVTSTVTGKDSPLPLPETPRSEG